MKLGIVPIALIAATAIGGPYGFYVWWEITPHPSARRVVQHTAPTPAPIAPAPTSPAVALNTEPQPVQPQPVQPQATPLAATTTAPHVTTHALRKKHRVPVRRYTVRKPAQSLSIEKQRPVDSITPLLEAGYNAYNNGDYALAQQNYRNVLRQDGNNHDALLGLAAIAQQQGDAAAASQYYGQLLELDPRDPQAQAGMSALEKSGNPADRETRLKLLLEQQPQSAALNFALGNLYAEQSRWAEAQQSYFSAYSLQPNAAQYAYNLAISLDHLEQAKLASQYYQRALQLDSITIPRLDHAQIQQRLQQLQPH